MGRQIRGTAAALMTVEDKQAQDDNGDDEASDKKCQKCRATAPARIVVSHKEPRFQIQVPF
jgi:hypothetical protein